MKVILIFCNIFLFLLKYSCGTHNSEYLNLLIGLNIWTLNFLFLCFVVFLINNLKNLKKVLIILLLVVTLNFSVYSHVIQKKFLVQTLWIGTLNIHPVIFYTATVFIYFYIFNKTTGSFLQKTLINNINILTLSVSALALGGLWGTQSLAWGYFWVNDAIEWSLFFLCIFLLYTKHKIKNITTPYFHTNNLCLIFTVLILIRLNFISTRHSFFSTFNLTLSISFIFLVIYFCTINFYRNIFKLKNPKNLSYFLILFYTGLVSGNYFIFLNKYITLNYLKYFILFNKIFTKNKNVFLIHMVVVLFCFSWSQNFINFFLNLYQSIFYFFKINIYLKTSLHNQNFFINIKNFCNQMELVEFNLNLNSSLYLKFLDKFVYESNFNTFVVYSLFILFFLLLI